MATELHPFVSPHLPATQILFPSIDLSKLKTGVPTSIATANPTWCAPRGPGEGGPSPIEVACQAAAMQTGCDGKALA